MDTNNGTETKKRLRAVSFNIQPNLMLVEGEDADVLTPVSVPPIVVPATEWENAGDLVAEALEEYRGQLES